jgi:hypothetical protein
MTMNIGKVLADVRQNLEINGKTSLDKSSERNSKSSERNSVEKILGDSKERKILEKENTREPEKQKQSISDTLLVIYFSGHCYTKDESIQLCPYNFDEKNIVETGQNLLNLKNRIMTTFPCKHVLFIFDCKFESNIFDE